MFTAVPILYLALKLAGAAYLIWLGVRMFRAKATWTTLEPARTAKSPRKAFWESVTVEVLNPKTALFYLAFLPQFTDPDAGTAIWVQLLVLGTIVNLMFSSADALCVVLAHKLAAYFKGSGAHNTIAPRIGGSILIALGFHIALARQ